MKCPKCKKELIEEEDIYNIETPNLIFELHLDCAIDFEGEMEDLLK